MKPTDKLLSPIERHGTVADEIAERLVLAIARGEQAPGSRLTEGSIAGAMNVSRVPAREALLGLAAKGILEPAGSRGLKVANFTATQAANIREVRLALETVALRHAMQVVRRNEEALASLDAILEEMQLLTREASALALAQCDIRFHRKIVSFCDNEVLRRCWEDLTPHLLVLFCKDWHAHSNGVGEVQLHTNLRRFLAEGDAADIEAVLNDHY